jgi:outer membrane protein OmpA-like peptidoglycan-associated protein
MLALLLSPAFAQPVPLAPDADADSVADAVDRCPGQAGPPGEDPAVADGCPKGAWFAADQLRTAARLAFEPGSARLTEADLQALEEVRARLAEQPSIRRVEVQGHTDNLGDPSANVRLSADRALAVVAHLEAAGIGPNRLVAHGYGGAHPLFTNRTAQGRERNQRVQFLILEGRPAPPGPPGLLEVRLASGGWATVAVDGRRLPQTAPFAGWSVPSGSHQLLVENPRTQVRFSTTVDIASGQTTAVVVPSGDAGP